MDQMLEKEAEREKTYEQMHKFMQDMSVALVRQPNKGPIVVDQHCGLSDFSEFQSMQGGPSSFSTQGNSSFFEGAQATPSYGHNMATLNWKTPMPSHPGTSNWQTQMSSCSTTPNWQTQMPSHPYDAGLFNLNILNRARREARPSMYMLSPYMNLPPSTVVPKKRSVKTKNKGKNANLSAFNLGNTFDEDNVGGDAVMFLGEHDIGHCLVYENVDPSKVRRGNYVDCMELLLNPYDVYLDCHMMGYMVPNYFWRQLVPHLCMPGSHSLARANQEGWLSDDVYMPINAGGNHWVMGAIDLQASLFYVYDSLHSEGTKLMLEQQVRDWTPVINGILQSRGCFNGTRR
ncbi:phospholipase-like protein [Tanacetum coccineum]|uniref:Phospholipase-like protein n=1 Tax=Tanacetum coccineum TaxID=301880 RepID=A0ABQ5BBJ6_9ASTR